MEGTRASEDNENIEDSCYSRIEGQSNEENPTDWKFAEVGDVNLISRDGSPHATDEVFNSASHLAALMSSLLGTVLLIAEASYQGEPWKIVSFSLYGGSLIFLFACSVLHHSISSSPQIMETLRMLDYLAIYPLISGTFTPLCLVFFHDSPIGWVFFGTVWLLAIVGMVMTHCMFAKIPKWLSMTMYITMGWLGALLSTWLYPIVGVGGMTLLVIGGLFYTIGGYIYTTEKPNPIPGTFGFHEIWHIAVMLGATSHWFLIYLYVLPWESSSESYES